MGPPRWGRGGLNPIRARQVLGFSGYFAFSASSTTSDRPETEAYYSVWRFLCEMPDAARNPRRWSRAIEPIFRPGDGTIAGTGRSSELIYRAWPTLNTLAEQGNRVAVTVRAAFWGEFEREILSGRRGEVAQRTARQFCQQFIELPTGEFHMGVPQEKQGMPPSLRRRWQSYVERKGDPEELAEQELSHIAFAPSKAGQDQKQAMLQWWTEVFRDRDIRKLEDRLNPGNQTPVKRVHHVDGFALNRWPTINAWYRLFDPGHGMADSWYRETYGRISPDEETPVIIVSWYDAWAFCLWARWDGESCRLPHEHEWEYAAKAGTQWDWNYWWGDEFKANKCNAEQKVGHTTRPDPARANPWGFEDILGNVWEWAEDEYRAAFDPEAPPPESTSRVLRGGSWKEDPFLARSACRSHAQMWYSDIDRGFRAARAVR